MKRVRIVLLRLLAGGELVVMNACIKSDGIYDLWDVLIPKNGQPTGFVLDNIFQRHEESYRRAKATFLLKTQGVDATGAR